MKTITFNKKMAKLLKRWREKKEAKGENPTNKKFDKNLKKQEKVNT
jgi:hypothetical protein